MSNTVHKPWSFMLCCFQFNLRNTRIQNTRIQQKKKKKVMVYAELPTSTDFPYFVRKFVQNTAVQACPNKYGILKKKTRGTFKNNEPSTSMQRPIHLHRILAQPLFCPSRIRTHSPSSSAAQVPQ